MSTSRVELFRSSSVLLQPEVLPGRQSELVSPQTACQYFGWPTCLNGSRPVTVVHTNSDHVTGLLREDPTLEPDEVKLVLSTSPGVTWWKGVEVVREIAPGDDSMVETLAGVYTQDSYHGPNIYTLRVADRFCDANLLLQFRKAGAFGVHITVYRIPLYLPSGHMLMLSWLCDRPLSRL